MNEPAASNLTTRVSRGSGPGGWTFLSEHLLVGAGTGTARVLAFLAIAVMGRWLGPEEFGRFSLAFYVMAVLAQLSSAVDNSMIKRIGAFPEESRAILRAALLLKAGLHASVLVAGLVLAWPVVALVLDKPNFLLLYTLALVGGGLTGLYNLALAYWQARQQFRMYATWSVGFSAATLAGVCAVNLLGERSALANLLLMIGLTLVAVTAWLARIGPGGALADAGAHIRPLWHFGAWLGVSTLAAAVHQRLDVFVLSRYADYAELGQYSAAVRVSMVPDLVNQAIAVVLFPKAMQVRDQGALRAFARESAVMLCLMAAAGVATMLLAGPLLGLFFGPQFGEAAPAARLLCAATMTLGIYAPISMLFYALDRPQLIAALGLFKLAAAVVLALALVPRLGAMGAALTMLLTNVGALLFVVFWAKKSVANAPWKNPPPSPS